ncbi:MAG: hypothetical protein QOG68_1544 [Solirubrobacteraceae bacterium]|jgi:hypothetical protein|nr:hypothetical protein [Solirubrobacteraceae bacterium]
MRRLTVLTVCLFALVVASGSASAATGKGSVDKTWISTTSGGKTGTNFKVSTVKRLYANFTWKVPASAGQALRIEWHDPSGSLRAVWKDKTIKGDKKGTRLYAWIGNGVVKGSLGGWKAILLVGGKPIGTAKFRITA